MPDTRIAITDRSVTDLPPAHDPSADTFALFSIETMKRPLDARGFDTVHVSHPGNLRSMRFIANFILALQIKNRRLFDRIRRFPFFNWRLTANLFDIMYVIGRRR
jgi:hypothetical protein